MNSHKRINGGRPLEWYLGVTAGHGDYGTLDGEPYVCHLPEYESDYAIDGDSDCNIYFVDFAEKYAAFNEKRGIVDFTHMDYRNAYLRRKGFDVRK